MIKRQAGPPPRERLMEIARMLTPTVPERLMAAAILLSLLAGALVMHYRTEYRLAHPAISQPSASPEEGSP